MGKLSKYEKETIINFNEGEKEASIYTFNTDLKRRRGHTLRNTALSLCRVGRILPDLGAFCNQNGGSGAGILREYRGALDIRGMSA